MNLGIHPFRAALAVAAAGCLIAGVAQPATAAPPDSVPSGVPQLEALDRGLVAVSTSEGVFLSWRLLASEATGATDTGLAGPDFAVYRDGEQLAVVTDSTNYADAAGTATAQYTVAPVVNGIELEASAPVSAWAQGYTDLPLQKPADGITPPTVIPNGSTSYTYSANDVSVGDVDGDGAYEYVVKWDPSNSKDVSQRGWTGPVYIDTYELDGTLLNRLDLGVNIRAGAHYTQFLVYDFDGDGRSETMLKTAPGTKSITYDPDGTVASEQYITMPEEDLEAGYAQTDDYRMSAADYQDHLVEMFRGWTEHPEVVAGNWPATLEQAWGIPVTHEYPLSEQSAEELADYFIDVYAPSRSGNNRLREFEGFIVDGPEYLTVFDSATGEELQTIAYKPGRDDDGLLWGDYAMARVEPGNRVDRFLSGVAYLDGRAPLRAVRPRVLHAHDDDHVRLGRQAPEGALVRRQRPRAHDEPVQRLAARPRRHEPRVREHHDAGRPLAERRRRRRRRSPGDRLRLRHDRRRRQRAVQLVRGAPRGQRGARCRTCASDTATRCTSPTSIRPARASRSGPCTRARPSHRTGRRCAMRRPARCSSASTPDATPAAA